MREFPRVPGLPGGIATLAPGASGDGSPPAPAPRTLEDLSLQALLELSQEIHTTGDLYRVAELGLLKIMGHLGTASSALWIRSDQTRRPVLLRSLGMPERIATALSEVCVDRIMAQGSADPTPVFVDDCPSSPGPGEQSLARSLPSTLPRRARNFPTRQRAGNGSRRCHSPMFRPSRANSDNSSNCSATIPSPRWSG